MRYSDKAPRSSAGRTRSATVSRHDAAAAREPNRKVRSFSLRTFFGADTSAIRLSSDGKDVKFPAELVNLARQAVNEYPTLSPAELKPFRKQKDGAPNIPAVPLFVLLAQTYMQTATVPQQVETAQTILLAGQNLDNKDSQCYRQPISKALAQANVLKGTMGHLIAAHRESIRGQKVFYINMPRHDFGKIREV